jgi:uncharacterized protein (TIGR03435 family)
MTSVSTAPSLLKRARRALLAAALLTAALAAPPVVPLALSQAAAFDVASVKPNLSSPLTPFAWRFGSNSVQITNLPLREIIAQAYDLGSSAGRPFKERFRLTGGDSKILSTRFDIVATAAGATDRKQLQSMLRTLLAERFRLRISRVTSQLPVYELLQARSGVLGRQLRASPHDCTAYRSVPRTSQDADNPRDAQQRLLCWPTLDALGMTRGFVELRSAGALSQFINSIQRYLDRPVVDGTGLKGNFEWSLRFSNPERPENQSELDETLLFSAIREQLGLKLEPRRGPVEGLHIDSVEMPTPD